MEISTARTGGEYKRIFRFRYAVYIEEMHKPIVGANHADRLLDDDLDPLATHLYAERDGEVIGALRINWGRSSVIPPTLSAWYGLHWFRDFSPRYLSFTSRMMVAPKFRRSAVTAALATAAYRLGRENGIEFDFIHTEPALVPFFMRLGHRMYKDDFVDPELGRRTPLVLVLEDAEHMRNCGSPFSRCTRMISKPSRAVPWFESKFGPVLQQAVSP